MKIQMISCAALAAVYSVFARRCAAAGCARGSDRHQRRAGDSSTAADAPRQRPRPRRRQNHRHHRPPPRCRARFDHALARRKPIYVRPEALEKQPGGTNLTLNKSLLQAPGRGPGQLRRHPRPQRARQPAVSPQRRHRPRKHQRLRHDLRSEDRKLDPAHHRHAAGAIRLPHRGRRQFQDPVGPARQRRRGGRLRRQLRLARAERDDRRARPAISAISCRAAIFATTSGSKTRCRRATRSTTERPRSGRSPTCPTSFRNPAASRCSAEASSAISRSRTSPASSGDFTVNGVDSFDAAKLDQNQREITHYARWHLSICGRHAELSDRAVRPLLADAVHARSQSRRHHLQRFRRRRAAVEPRGRSAGRREPAARQRPHAALRGLLPERAHDLEGRLHGASGQRLRRDPTGNPDQRRAVHDHRPGQQDRPALRRLSAGRVEADADAHAQLRRALSTSCAPTPGSSSSARAPISCGTRLR